MLNFTSFLRLPHDEHHELDNVTSQFATPLNHFNGNRILWFESVCVADFVR